MAARTVIDLGEDSDAPRLSARPAQKTAGKKRAREAARFAGEYRTPSEPDSEDPHSASSSEEDALEVLKGQIEELREEMTTRKKTKLLKASVRSLIDDWNEYLARLDKRDGTIARELDDYDSRIKAMEEAAQERDFERPAKRRKRDAQDARVAKLLARGEQLESQVEALLTRVEQLESQVEALQPPPRGDEA